MAKRRPGMVAITAELCPMTEEEAKGIAVDLLLQLQVGRGETIRREEFEEDRKAVAKTLLEVAEKAAEKVRLHTLALAMTHGDEKTANDLRNSGPIRLTECC